MSEDRDGFAFDTMGRSEAFGSRWRIVLASPRIRSMRHRPCRSCRFIVRAGTSWPCRSATRRCDRLRPLAHRPGIASHPIHAPSSVPILPLHRAGRYIVAAPISNAAV